LQESGTNEQKLNIVIESHTEDAITMSMKFTDPSSISSSGNKDKVRLTLVAPELFLSEDGQGLNL
jgi:hypothetical protein